MVGVERTIETDVLVIGGGGAACRAAIAAHDAGARTILVLKGKLGASGATVAPGRGVAWQAADDCSSPEDSPEVHFRNIMDAGLGMADPRLARLLAYEVLERMDELEDWGLRFVPDPSGRARHYSAYSCFGDQPRAHCILNSGHGHAGDIVMVLRKQMAMRDIEVHEEVFVSDLLVPDGVCRGALALGPNGEVVAYHTGAVVLAAGGARQLFPPAGEHRIDTTGDGYAMALRAGARLTNMEYMQLMLRPTDFGPFDMPGSFWALFPVLRDEYGEDALAAYLPPGVTRQQAMYERTLHEPFSCRDASGWLDVAIATEVREGRGSPEGGLYLDFSQVDLNRFRPSRPNHIPVDYDKEVVLPKGRPQVRHAAHAINGGVLINGRAESTLPGLYAAGEVAAGPHGADRLGGGMVTNCQVFGARAGRYAAEWAFQGGDREPSPTSHALPLARLRRHGGGERRAEDVLVALQRASGAHLMVVRHERGLLQVLDRIQDLRRGWLPAVAARNARTLRRAIEVENSLLTAELMARAALMRRESRGSHFREDYPQQDDGTWRVNILFRQADGSLEQEMGRLG